MMCRPNILFLGFVFLILCGIAEAKIASKKPLKTSPRPEIYAPIKLTTDLSKITENQKKMLSSLIDAAKIMDDLFWQQAYGNKKAILESVDEEQVKQFISLNYGPWDRLKGNQPFIETYGKKPLGSQFYPEDMSKQEFLSANISEKDEPYSLIRRNKSGQLVRIPYHKAYFSSLKKTSDFLNKAADKAENKKFADFLRLRARALLNDDYQSSDMVWMDMKNNPFELVIGPIETYEDQLLGYKASYSAYLLKKDSQWSNKLAKYMSHLPRLQKELPVPALYKSETPGTSSDIYVYDLLYAAGDCNAGSKTIAINLPNDEEVQLKKGTRRLQLKNAMKAKFNKILTPIASELIVKEQLKHINFDAFFNNTMFHEVAHGLGIKNTIDGKSTVRAALKETGAALEEGKADILGVYMISKLQEMGIMKNIDLMDHYVTFMAGIFRSVRFGTSSSHGKANIVRFNYFAEKGAFTRDNKSGRYRIHKKKFQNAINNLSELILRLQGDGDYEGARTLFKNKGVIDQKLQEDLARLNQQNIPVDISFIQGKKVLGLS